MILSKTDREIQKRVLDKVIAERDRQDAKFGSEDLCADPFLWLRILMEEVGEVAAEVEFGPLVTDEMKKELVQVAAVAVGWLEDIEHIDTKG